MEDLVGMITKHLKKGERVKIAGLGILQVRIVLPAWAAIRRPVSRSRSRPAKRSPSAPPRNSRWRSDRRGQRPLFMPNDMDPRPLRDQTTARAYFLPKTGRPSRRPLF